MAFGDDMTLFMVSRDAVGAVPGTVLASDAAGIVVKNDTVIKFDVAVGGASDQTGRINTVVAAHGVEQQEGIGEAPPLHFADAAPFDIGGIVVLLVTGHFAAAAPDAGRRIEVETVLFPL